MHDEQAHPWPVDTTKGAELILKAACAILEGPAAMAYLQPGMDGHPRLQLRQIMEDAGTMAGGAMEQSWKRRRRGEQGTPQRGEGLEGFFQQVPGSGHGR